MCFEDILKATQPQLKEMMQAYLIESGFEVTNEPGFLYAKGEIPVLLVAHLDTVHKDAPSIICYSKDGFIMSPQGIGGDDRCGVFMISEILKTHRCSVVFCEDEETGGKGAKKFAKSKIEVDVNYMIELDRKGSKDAVFYSCANNKFESFICKGTKLKTEIGSYSDICDLAPHFQVAAVNISSGYYNPHTTAEVISMFDIESVINIVKSIIDKPCKKFKYIAKPTPVYKSTYNLPYNQYNFIDVVGLERDDFIILDDGLKISNLTGWFLGRDSRCYVLGDDNYSVILLEGRAYTKDGKRKRWNEYLDTPKSKMMYRQSIVPKDLYYVFPKEEEECLVTT